MKKGIRCALLLAITIVLVACQQKLTLKDIVECDGNVVFQHDKIIRDAKNYYEITIGKDWKRELFVDQQQSRIYAADTTKNYSASFLIDVTRFDGRIVLDSTFQKNIISQIKSLPRSYVIKEGFIEFQEQPAYSVFSFQKTDTAILYQIQCYVAAQDHYFLLSSNIHGNQNLSNNLCESISIFNSLNLIP
ncbi:hypothetical protein Q4595_14260 [Wenyingzhuangia sp. 1_MG-2023]|nr:hypothetical protein [Wenyingzhuangia sp. 1_MG-2023]